MFIQDKKLLIEFAKKMIKDELTVGTAGNISIYDPVEKAMVITPSGIPYDNMNFDDLVVMDLDLNILEGKNKPSTESFLHALVYKNREDVKSIVHTHSIYATSYSTLRRPLAALHYIMADLGGEDIKCAEYEVFGTQELAEAALIALKDRKGCLLANHGVLALGKDVKEAYSNARTIEYIAKMYHIVRFEDDVHILSKKDIDAVIERMKSYGQK